MGIQTMGSQINNQQSLLQPTTQLNRQNSWYSLTLDEVKNQLGDLGKPMGSMNLDELLQNVWTVETNLSMGTDNENNSSSSSLQRQASFTLAMALSGKTVDDVWREIQQGQKKRFGHEDVKGQERESTLGETTLEDFLVQAGLFAEASLNPLRRLEEVDTILMPHCDLLKKTSLSSSPLIGALSDKTILGRKRDGLDVFEKSMERMLRRKIKNRESAARSRARKQAYHNELVNKVSRLEEDNMKLKNEKEFEKRLKSESVEEAKYQLRRTTSSSL